MRGRRVVVVIGGVIGAITARLADYHDPEDEEEFEALVRRSERLARENLAAEPDEHEFMSSTRSIPTTSRSSCARRSTTCPTS